jgi:hypothetical protein
MIPQSVQILSVSHPLEAGAVSVVQRAGSGLEACLLQLRTQRRRCLLCIESLVLPAPSGRRLFSLTPRRLVNYEMMAPFHCY